MSGWNPFEGMPDGMWQAEWVAMKMQASYPGVSDPGYLEAVKAGVLEILGDRSYPGRQRSSLREYLEARGYTAAGGFPDNPGGCRWPVDEGSSGDLFSFEAMDAVIEDLCARAFAERDRRLKMIMPRVTVDYSDRLKRAIRDHDEEYGKQ